MLVKKHIQNPYVNVKFQDWKSVSIEDKIAFYIPEQWSLEKQEEGYAIVDREGQIWAKGDFVHADTTKEFNRVFGQTISDQILDSEVDFSFAGSGLMDGSTVQKWYAHVDEGTVECYVACLLEDMDSSFYWIVECDSASEKEQYDILEAITYSFAFYSDLNRYKWLM